MTFIREARTHFSGGALIDVPSHTMRDRLLQPLVRRLVVLRREHGKKEGY
jgi:hypothetical protein